MIKLRVGPDPARKYKIQEMPKYGKCNEDILGKKKVTRRAMAPNPARGRK